MLLKLRTWSHLKGAESMAGICWRSSEAREAAGTTKKMLTTPSSQREEEIHWFPSSPCPPIFHKCLPLSHGLEACWQGCVENVACKSQLSVTHSRAAEGRGMDLRTKRQLAFE